LKLSAPRPFMRDSQLRRERRRFRSVVCAAFFEMRPEIASTRNAVSLDTRIGKPTVWTLPSAVSLSPVVPGVHASEGGKAGSAIIRITNSMPNDRILRVSRIRGSVGLGKETCHWRDSIKAVRRGLRIKLM
jgi:hypothetical protein